MKTLATAAALVLLMINPVLGQDKKATMKVIAENDKARAYEVTFAPGTLERTYADGKKEKVTYKTGQVSINEPSPAAYTAKNIGKSAIKLYVVQLK